MDFKWFLNPIQNHYADFDGRATREEFWMYVLFYIGAAIIASIAGEVLHVKLLDELLMVVLLLPSLAIGARRLHDTGKSGWWQLLCLIPVIGSIILLVLFIFKGEEGSNKYGAPVTATASNVASEAIVHDVEVVRDTVTETNSETPVDTLANVAGNEIDEKKLD